MVDGDEDEQCCKIKMGHQPSPSLSKSQALS